MGGIEVDSVLNIGTVQSRALKRANALPLASDASGAVGNGDARVGQSLKVEAGPVGIHTRDLNGERVGVLGEFARVEEDDVERLVGRAGEDVKVPEVGTAARGGSAHLEAVEVAGLGEVLHADGAVGINGLQIDGSRGGVGRRAKGDARQSG